MTHPSKLIIDETYHIHASNSSILYKNDYFKFVSSAMPLLILSMKLNLSNISRVSSKVGMEIQVYSRTLWTLHILIFKII